MPRIRYSPANSQGAVVWVVPDTYFVVNVNWNSSNREWNVNTWQRDDNRWNEGKRVFSPETISVLPTLVREFSFPIPSSMRRRVELLITR